MKWLRRVFSYLGLRREVAKPDERLLRRADALLADYRRQDKAIRLTIIKKPR